MNTVDMLSEVPSHIVGGHAAGQVLPVSGPGRRDARAPRDLLGRLLSRLAALETTTTPTIAFALHRD